MKHTDWTDDEGRNFRVALPDGAADSEGSKGVPVGPPDLSDVLGDVPRDTLIRLHNQLHARGLFTLADVRRNPDGLFAALQAAFRLDVAALAALYQPQEDESR